MCCYWDILSGTVLQFGTVLLDCFVWDCFVQTHYLLLSNSGIGCIVFLFSCSLKKSKLESHFLGFCTMNSWTGIKASG